MQSINTTPGESRPLYPVVLLKEPRGPVLMLPTPQLPMPQPPLSSWTPWTPSTPLSQPRRTSSQLSSTRSWHRSKQRSSASSQPSSR
eukprot:6493750-Pyramimonas_sp.AAC.1